MLVPRLGVTKMLTPVMACKLFGGVSIHEDASNVGLKGRINTSGWFSVTVKTSVRTRAPDRNLVSPIGVAISPENVLTLLNPVLSSRLIGSLNNWCDDMLKLSKDLTKVETMNKATPRKKISQYCYLELSFNDS